MTLLYIICGLVAVIGFLWFVDNYVVDLGFIMPVVKEIGKTMVFTTSVTLLLCLAIYGLYLSSIQIWGKNLTENAILAPLTSISAAIDTFDTNEDLALGPQYAKAKGWYVQNCGEGDSVQIEVHEGIHKDTFLVSCLEDNRNNVYYFAEIVGSIKDPVVMESGATPGLNWVAWAIRQEEVPAHFILWAWLRG